MAGGSSSQPSDDLTKRGTTRSAARPPNYTGLVVRQMYGRCLLSYLRRQSPRVGQLGGNLRRMITEAYDVLILDQGPRTGQSKRGKAGIGRRDG